MATPTLGARRPSAAWGRLKSVSMDPLESMGLPSKGDNRLLDFKTQEVYYNKIVDRYMKFCAASGGGNELEKQFSTLSISATDGASGSSLAQTTVPNVDLSTERELSTVVTAMRKLREGIVATARTDTFSQRVYVFIIRASILTKTRESYYPALLHLLERMHPTQPLSAPELHEFVGYRILDLVCRQQDFTAAYEVRHTFKYSDRRVNNVLDALIHDNWHLFWKMRKAVDGYQKKLLEWAEEGVRVQALKCLGRTYLSVDRRFVERTTEKDWDGLKKSNGVGWDLEGWRIIIRRPKER
ncbi:MAG: hypothetical protein M1812_006527 [Candelaria pacifica]|nr:MAG: hypothetical protein M1812_006527 [Candelaria pacifica]